LADVIGGYRGKQHRHPFHVGSGVPSAFGDAGGDYFITGLVMDQVHVHPGIHEAGGDGVDADSLACLFIGQCFGELGHLAFGCGISRDGDVAKETQQRGAVDDLAAYLGQLGPVG